MLIRKMLTMFDLVRLKLRRLAKMKNRSKIVSIVFISFIILAQIAFISVPTARAYSL